jgi:serine/threonine protein phosphatase 1
LPFVHLGPSFIGFFGFVRGPGSKDIPAGLLGDLIDRGPDSKGVIDTILELQASGYDVRPIRGNHEQMLLISIYAPYDGSLSEWLDNGGYTTLKSYGASHPEELGEHIYALHDFPPYRTTETHIFVHAGLDFTLDDPLSHKGEKEMLTKRSGNINEAKLNGRILVSGHTPQPIFSIRSSLRSSHIRLDNGCVYGDVLPYYGNLVALELESGALHVQENID